MASNKMQACVYLMMREEKWLNGYPIGTASPLKSP